MKSIILIPSDHAENYRADTQKRQVYKQNIKDAIADVQSFYQNKLTKTFNFNTSDEIEEIFLPKPLGDTTQLKTTWDAFNRLMPEAWDQLNLVNGQTVVIWIIGTSNIEMLVVGNKLIGWNIGYAVLSNIVLDNLTSDEVYPPMRNYQTKNSWKNVGRGLIAHELGHGFGLLSNVYAKFHSCAEKFEENCTQKAIELSRKTDNTKIPLPPQNEVLSGIMASGLYFFPLTNDQGFNNTIYNPEKWIMLQNPFMNPPLASGENSPQPQPSENQRTNPPIFDPTLPRQIYTSPLSLSNGLRLMFSIHGHKLVDKGSGVVFEPTDPVRAQSVGDKIFGQEDGEKIELQSVEDPTIKLILRKNDFSAAELNLQQLSRKVGTNVLHFGVKTFDAQGNQKDLYTLEITYVPSLQPTVSQVNLCQQQNGICSDAVYGDQGGTKISRDSYQWYQAGDSGCTEGLNNHCYVLNEAGTVRRGAAITEVTPTPNPCILGTARCAYECAPNTTWYCTGQGVSARCYASANPNDTQVLTTCPVTTPTPNFSGAYTCRVSGVNGFCGAKTGAEAQKFQTYCQGNWDYRSNELTPNQCTADQFCYTDCTHDPRR